MQGCRRHILRVTLGLVGTRALVTAAVPSRRARAAECAEHLSLGRRPTVAAR